MCLFYEDETYGMLILLYLSDITDHYILLHFENLCSFSRLCSGERRVVFEHVIREIRPICEVEYIRKILALKRVSREIIFMHARGVMFFCVVTSQGSLLLNIMYYTSALIF
jgi:hypothetical protein